MSPVIWIAAAAAFLLSFATVIVLRPLLRRYGVLDAPSDRSSHTTVTLRGGGVAPLVGIVAGAVIALLAALDSGADVVLAVLAGALFAALIGFVEDTRGLRVPIRALAQIVAGAAIAIPLGMIFGQRWWVIGFALVAIMLFINITNFMDGINGISGVHAAVIGAVYAIVGISTGLSWATALGAVLAAAFLGFLPWNLTKPGLFLGDIGSYLLGAVLSGLAFSLLWAGVEPIVVVAPLSIYLVDTLFTIGRRASRGEAILQSHRSHAYQRLTDTGLSHAGTTVVVAGFTACASVVGLLAETGMIPTLAAWAILIAIGALYLVLPSLRGSRLPRITSMDIPAITSPSATPSRPAHAPEAWAIVGASGFVGSALIARLREAGADVRAVKGPRLSLAPHVSSPQEIVALAADQSELSEMTAQLEGVDVVVNAAGLATPGAPPTSDLYGANALLPAVIMHASDAAKVSRVIHLSSAAVQGHRAVLDDTIDVSPFSPYSRSKALGERAFLSVARDASTDAVIIRATSVQGRERPTTESLRRVARSALASVAGDGTQPTVVSTIDGLTDFVVRVGRATTPVGPIMLQPWEGMSTAEVLRAAGGKEPTHLPVWFCVASLTIAKLAGRVVPEIAGIGRRVELMWLGQRQRSAYEAEYQGGTAALSAVLSGAAYSAAREGSDDGRS